MRNSKSIEEGTPPSQVSIAKVEPSDGQAAPGSAVESTLEERPEDILAQMWRTVLGVDNVNAGDNFFALGGESLSLIRLAHMIEEHLSVKVTVRDLIRSPTLGQMSTLVAVP